MQLDEVSFPLVLAWRLSQARALGAFDPCAMAAAACGFLMREGPVTPQDRWEEASGFSPSTLAINIAGLICAAELIEGDGDPDTATFVREYADFLEAHVEAWTVTTQGTLHPQVSRHYIRINPNNTGGDEDPNAGMLTLANQPPEGPFLYPAKEIVDRWISGTGSLWRSRSRRSDCGRLAHQIIDAVLRWTCPRDQAGGATTMTAMASTWTARVSRAGESAARGRCADR